MIIKNTEKSKIYYFGFKSKEKEVVKNEEFIERIKKIFISYQNKSKLIKFLEKKESLVLKKGDENHLELIIDDKNFYRLYTLDWTIEKEGNIHLGFYKEIPFEKIKKDVYEMLKNSIKNKNLTNSDYFFLKKISTEALNMNIERLENPEMIENFPSYIRFIRIQDNDWVRNMLIKYDFELKKWPNTQKIQLNNYQNEMIYLKPAKRGSSKKTF